MAKPGRHSRESGNPIALISQLKIKMDDQLRC